LSLALAAPAVPAAATASSAESSAGEEGVSKAANNRLYAIILRRVLFPLVSDYLKPLNGSPDSVNESRVRICSLLISFLLQHFRTLYSTDEFMNLWTDAMRLLEQHFEVARSNVRPGNRGGRSYFKWMM